MWMRFGWSRDNDFHCGYGQYREYHAECSSGERPTENCGFVTTFKLFVSILFDSANVFTYRTRIRLWVGFIKQLLCGAQKPKPKFCRPINSKHLAKQWSSHPPSKFENESIRNIPHASNALIDIRRPTHFSPEILRQYLPQTKSRVDAFVCASSVCAYGCFVMGALSHPHTHKHKAHRFVSDGRRASLRIHTQCGLDSRV